jgi:hypothetical protein
VAGSSEHGYGPLSSIEYGVLLGQLSDCEVFKKHPAHWC